MYKYIRSNTKNYGESENDHFGGIRDGNILNVPICQRARVIGVLMYSSDHPYIHSIYIKGRIGSALSDHTH